MTFAEDAARVLARVPREDAPPAPEPARHEALSFVKRADAALARDPRGAGPAQALPLWVEALDLDPSCKPAYEAIAKAVLARGEGDRAAAEAALRFVSVGLVRLPQDSALRELEKKLRAFVPAKPAEPALAVKTTRKSERRPMAGHGAGRTCDMCRSPIPIGAAECRSCSLSGELPRPAGVMDRTASSGTSPVVLAIVAILIIGGGAAVWYAVTHKAASSAHTVR